MKWLWWRRDAADEDRDTSDRSHAERAQESLAKAQADEPRIADLTERIHLKLAENHWSPKIAAAFREGRQ